MVYFREIQQFRQWWLWLAIAIGSMTIWYAAYRRFATGTKPPPDGMQLLLWVLIGIGLPLLFYMARLVTEVRSDGLYLASFHFTGLS